MIKRMNLTGLVALQVIRERVVKSLCPICKKVIDARIYQEGNAVIITKKCEYHGEFKDIYWSDAELYRRILHFSAEGSQCMIEKRSYRKNRDRKGVVAE